MKHKYIIWITPLALMVWVSCNKPKKQNTALPPTPVNVAEAKKGEAVYYDQYQGTVVALNNVELRAQVAGYITGILFREGEIVEKGKPLYEIDRRKYQAAYDQAVANLASAQANLVKAQKDVDRYNYLAQNDAVAKQTVDQAVATLATNKSAVEVAKAGIESAKTDLSYSTIRAPFTGRIGISQVKLGAAVTPGSTLLNTISSEQPIGVDFVINETDIARFYGLQKKTTDSTFKLQLSDGVTTYKKPGKILAIDRGVNNQTGTITVRLQFANNDDVLKDGMSCVVKVLNSESGNRLLIPYKSVIEQMGEYFVFVAKDSVVNNPNAKSDTAKKQRLVAAQVKVQTGQTIGPNVVIKSGITEGQRIVVDGVQSLHDGSPITTANKVAPSGRGR